MRRKRKKQIKILGLVMAGVGAVIVIHFVPIFVWYVALAVMAILLAFLLIHN